MNKGIYIHYPFCDKKCLYCDFFSVPDKRKSSLYEKALTEGIRFYKDRGFGADTIFFGGGTPSLMSEEGMKAVFDSLKGSFTIPENAEITLEMNPSGNDEILKKLPFFRSLGINRLSIGAQSFVDAELQALGRRHTGSDIKKAVAAARSAGFDNISLDLMARTPHQSIESFDESLRRAVECGVEHLSVYTLSIEDKTVFGKRAKQGDNLYLASEDDEEEMYFNASSFLKSCGFGHYEISNFSKRGFESRHNLKYWHAEEYIGIGASAHSYLDGVRFSSKRSIDAFIENPLLRDSEEKIDENTALLEKLMLGLRLREGIDLSVYDLNEQFYTLVGKLERSGLANHSENRLSLTEKGFRVSNSIIASLLDAAGMM